jgi:hypothetical protein
VDEEQKLKIMNAFKNIGLVVFGNSQKKFRLAPVSRKNGYRLKKVLVGENVYENSVRASYPEAEIVRDKTSIIQDTTLDLVIFVSPIKKYMNLVGEVLRSGKPVRVVSEM